MRKIRRRMPLLSGLAALAGPLAAALPAVAQELPLLPPWAAESVRAVCRDFAEGAAPSDETVATHLGAMADTIAVTRAGPRLYSAAAIRDGFDLTLTVRLPGTPQSRTRLTAEERSEGGTRGRPAFFVQAGPDCRTELARAVAYDADGAPDRLIHFAGDPPAETEAEALNPPVPEGKDPGGVAVATIDTGVNYLLPEIAPRLARDETGAILGADLFDQDGRPFDLDPRQGPLFPRRHGSAVASILLSEAPAARLVPFRYPGRDAEAFADLIERIAAGPARIVSMPLGGYRAEEWRPFAQAAARHPELLFVLSAGNDGRDIDASPVYPAAFENDNFLTVTSADPFGRLAAESNWGAAHVDIAVPGEQIPAIDHRGARGKASGTSYAAPRVAALAARFLAAHPDWDAARLKAEIIARAIPLPRGGGDRPIRHGWLPDPAAVEVE
ncbi:MAG: S8 family serine peptidase [Hyphomicrobiales bacterium]|nr:S8 family serine peptidase [Hyphomicrobiales bacterium]